jgi:hypothetical protein
MRIAGFVGIFALAGQLVTPSAGAEKSRALAVYIDNRSSAPLATVGRAQTIVRAMFAGIGVAIRWRSGAPKPEQVEKEWPVVVTITSGTPPEFEPGRFASALPYEGVHLRVLYDRLRWAEERPHLLPRLLAHVMAHEIAHLAQGIGRHSDSGLMKERYSEDDFLTIQMKGLSFEPVDIDLIHSGLDRRASRLARRLRVRPDEN